MTGSMLPERYIQNFELYWIRAQVGNRKGAESRCGSQTVRFVVVFLKRHNTTALP